MDAGEISGCGTPAGLRSSRRLRRSWCEARLVGAAHFADKLDSRFPRGAHDNHVELATASVACAGGYLILITSAHVAVYEEMGYRVSELEAWERSQRGCGVGRHRLKIADGVEQLR